jgi:hypothetical protein
MKDNNVVTKATIKIEFGYETIFDSLKQFSIRFYDDINWFYNLFTKH